MKIIGLIEQQLFFIVYPQRIKSILELRELFNRYAANKKQLKITETELKNLKTDLISLGLD